jgi:hypothetical protein
MKRTVIWGVSGLILAVLAGVIVFMVIHTNQPQKAAVKPAGPVPSQIAAAVTYKIYYPDQAKLPAGYVLDRNSFANPVKNGISYSVNYDNDKKIVFSVQIRPSDNELQSFQSNFIPLSIDFQTPLGQGAIGAYHGQTLASLPIENGPWVVATAPADVNQDNLKQVLRALKQN